MQPDEQEETAESLGLMLEEHIAECGYPTDGRAELGGES